MGDDQVTRRKFIGLGVGAAALGITGVAGAHPGSDKPAADPAAARTVKDEALPQVPRRVLGKTGQKIPILLFGGAVTLDPRFDPKLAEALRFGVDYLDAADCYGGGTCEGAVGSFLERARARSKVWITSKSDAHDPAGFEKTLATSLERLKTDHVDLYYLHAFQDPKYISAELEKVVARLKKEGKMRFFGFSCHDGNVAELLQLAAKTPWIDSVMFRYNFRQYGNQELNQAIDAAHKAGVGLIAMKTQSSEAGIADAWKKFEQTGKWNKFQAVLKAVWADERITAAVSHMDSFEKLKQNVAAAVDRSQLSSLEQRSIERYAAATRGLACDGCDQRCGSAVAAPVKIGDAMRALMYHDAYGEPERARALFRRLRLAAPELAAIDFAPATAACPYGVDVAAMMRRAAEVLA